MLQPPLLHLSPSPKDAAYLHAPVRDHLPAGYELHVPAHIRRSRSVATCQYAYYAATFFLMITRCACASLSSPLRGNDLLALTIIHDTARSHSNSTDYLHCIMACCPLMGKHRDDCT